MATPLVIKKSPVVIIRNLIILQIAVTIVYFVASLIGNYQALYQELSLPQLASYEIAKTLFIGVIEALLIALIFLRWYFTTYTIYQDMVVYEWGVVWKRRQMWPLEQPTTATVHFSPLARFFRYGTIIIRGHQPRPITLTHIPEPETYSKLINGHRITLIPHQEETEAPATVEQFLTGREHEKLEFKTTFRWDVKEQKVNKALEKVVMKSVAAFLNSDGGHLVLGVNDGGQVLGLEHDYSSLSKKDRDGFENHFTHVFNNVIGPEFRRFVKISFHQADSKDVCLIQVLPSIKPVYAKFENAEEFYIRTGNSTTALRLSEANLYVQSRWRED